MAGIDYDIMLSHMASMLQNFKFDKKNLNFKGILILDTFVNPFGHNDSKATAHNEKMSHSGET